jgi:hypothetical protein
MSTSRSSARNGDSSGLLGDDAVAIEASRPAAAAEASPHLELSGEQKLPREDSVKVDDGGTVHEFPLFAIHRFPVPSALARARAGAVDILWQLKDPRSNGGDDHVVTIHDESKIVMAEFFELV